MNPVLYRYRDSESVIKPLEGYTPGEGWTPLYDQAALDAAVAAALERAAAARMKLPPPKHVGDVTAIQCVYQDAFDRGWKAGIAEMRKTIRALKENKE